MSGDRSVDTRKPTTDLPSCLLSNYNNMGFGSYTYKQFLKEQLTSDAMKGDIDLGGLHLTWDFEEFIKEKIHQEEMKERMDFLNVDGRIMMYNLGII